MRKEGRCEEHVPQREAIKFKIDSKSIADKKSHFSLIQIPFFTKESSVKKKTKIKF